MNNMLPGAVAFIVGALLGAFYFIGLWWTVRKGVVAKHPALWFSVSMLLRTIIILVGFYFVGRDHWERLLVCLLGFMVSRTLVMRLTRLTQARAELQIAAIPPNSEVRSQNAESVPNDSHEISLPSSVSSQPEAHKSIENADIKPSLSPSDSCILTSDFCADSTKLNRTSLTQEAHHAP